MSKKEEKWKTRFDSTYFFSHQTLSVDALTTVRSRINVSMSISLHLSRAKEPDSVLIKLKKK